MPNVDQAKLEKAVTISADLVANISEDYWPVFELLDDAMATRQARFRRLKKFKSIHKAKP